MFEVSLSFSLSLLQSFSLSLHFCTLTNQLQTDHELTKQNTGQWKRALVSALSVGLGAIGGVTGYVLLRLLVLLFIDSSSISSLSIFRNNNY